MPLLGKQTANPIADVCPGPMPDFGFDAGPVVRLSS
jgi:hypothetical protein